MIYKNKSLKEYNSFAVDVKAKYLVTIKNEEEINEYLSNKDLVKEYTVIIGDATNVLFVKDFDGVVMKIGIKGIKKVKEDNKNIWLKVGAGENWHEFVMYAVDKNLGGVENMALIPGTVGGASAGNIAAYGQNFCDVFVGLDVIDKKTGEKKYFYAEDFDLTYRKPLFDGEDSDRYIITYVDIRLNKDPDKIEMSYHERKNRYGSMEEELQKIAKEPYTIKDVAQAVINIRERKLPNLDEYGSCGSFFRNPVVNVEKFKELSEKISELQSYPVDKLSYDLKDWQKVDKFEYVKIPVGRLLDELGWRDRWIGNAGVFKNHALCVVSNKKATGEEILTVVRQMKKEIFDNYGVEISTEVRIIGGEI